MSDIQKRVNAFAVTHYPKVDSDKLINAEFSLSNKACHANAVAAYRAGRGDKVWLVWAGGEYGAIHFINSKQGKFFDETWHDYDAKESYRLIREIKPCEFDDIYEILEAAKVALISAVGTRWQRYRVMKSPHGLI